MLLNFFSLFLDIVNIENHLILYAKPLSKLGEARSNYWVQINENPLLQRIFTKPKLSLLL